LSQPFGVLAILLLTLSACERGIVGPESALVAGTYVMTAVSGRGPTTGSITLSWWGEAERRVRYRQSTGTLSSEYVARGTFQVRADGTVDLRLREDDGQSPHVWRPFAQLDGGVLVLRHPDPADGPDIVETYQRVERTSSSSIVTSSPNESLGLLSD
jgi:hypothetical protein